MDYLDTKKRFRQHVLLFAGYVLIAIAIAIGTLILLYQAYGFNLGKGGTVIQNGLTFFSSHPHPAKIYIDGQLKSVTTNTRLALPAGICNVKLSRDGYRDWQRSIELEGGSVQHYDYPFLIPKTLSTKKLRTYNKAPALMTQSPNQRWLLVENPGSLTNFSIYDLKNPIKPPTSLILPSNLLTKTAKSGENWQFDEWADDNQHLLLKHNFNGRTEFVLIDRIDPAKSRNLNNDLKANPGSLTLKNKKYDQYYAYDRTTKALRTASLKTPLAPELQHVLAYRSYGSDTLLYVTTDGAQTGKVLVKLKVGNRTLNIRSLSAGTSYLVDLAKYGDTMYVAAGDKADNKVYIFKDPVGQLAAQPEHAVVPTQVLRVPKPNYLSFSPNAQFIVTSNDNYFGVYDIENETGHNFSVQEPLDKPQTHAGWMDGSHLTYVTGGNLIIFDYDGTNHQLLVSADSRYLPAFAPDYKDVYMMAPAGRGQISLTQSSLLIPADR